MLHLLLGSKPQIEAKCPSWQARGNGNLKGYEIDKRRSRPPRTPVRLSTEAQAKLTKRIENEEYVKEALSLV